MNHKIAFQLICLFDAEEYEMASTLGHSIYKYRCVRIEKWPDYFTVPVSLNLHRYEHKYVRMWNIWANHFANHAFIACSEIRDISNRYNHLSVLGLKLNHVSKGAPGVHFMHYMTMYFRGSNTEAVTIMNWNIIYVCSVYKDVIHQTEYVLPI